jgi:catechol 2,3-dioxygenase-like lactoylglutathione lyase family enzyme
MRVKQISAITVRVSKMARAVEFYGDILGLEVHYGGKV